MNTRHNCGRVLPTAAILLAAFAAGLGLWLGAQLLMPRPVTVHAATLYPTPRAVPPFELKQAGAKVLTPADWKGHWTLVFFGFTQCPDVCPTTLGVLKQVRASLHKSGIDDQQLGITFISVDPERDTPEVLARYAAFYDPSFVAATGSDDELTRLTRALGLLYTRTPLPDGGYTVDHGASIFAINPQGQLAGMFRPPLDAAAIGADMLTLIRNR